MRRLRIGIALGVCVLFAPGMAATARAYIYWSGDGSTLALGRANNDASGVDTSLITGQPTPPIAVLAYDGYLYFNSEVNGNPTIARATIFGNDVDQGFVTGLSFVPNEIVTDGTNLYWSDLGDPDIASASLGSGGTADNTFIETGLQNGNGIGGLALVSGQPATLYLISESGIYSVPAMAGQTPSTVISWTASTTAVTPSSLADDDGQLFWAGYNEHGGSDSYYSIGEADLSNDSVIFDYQSVPAGVPLAVATSGKYLYWTVDSNDASPSEINQGVIGASGLSDVEAPFIALSAPPGAIAIDSAIDPTTTTVSCNPASVPVGQASACTITVADSASSVAPTGTVNLSASGMAYFSGSCSVSVNTNSCTVGATPTVAGTVPVTADYVGDSDHQTSSGSFSLCAGPQCFPTSTTPTGTTTTPTGSTTTPTGTTTTPTGTTPAKKQCIVPKLAARTLAQAKTLLLKARCSVGKVTEPAVRKGHKKPALIVGSTKPAVGTRLAAGAKVDLRLIAKPKPKRHKRR
jgi:hypothetical protein